MRFLPFPLIDARERHVSMRGRPLDPEPDVHKATLDPQRKQEPVRVTLTWPDGATLDFHGVAATAVDVSLTDARRPDERVYDGFRSVRIPDAQEWHLDLAVSGRLEHDDTTGALYTFTMAPDSTDPVTAPAPAASRPTYGRFGEIPRGQKACECDDPTPNAAHLRPSTAIPADAWLRCTACRGLY